MTATHGPGQNHSHRGTFRELDPMGNSITSIILAQRDNISVSLVR